MNRYSNQLKLYPIIQVIIFIPSTINRIYNITTNKESFELTLIQCIFDNTYGLIFACVYGFNETVRNNISESIEKIFCKKKETQNKQSELKETSTIDSNKIGDLTYMDETLIY
jgi:hypothetical protein